MESWIQGAREASPPALVVESTVKIFVSYCQRDSAYLEQDSLLGFLRGLERERVEFWTDRRIATGELWDNAIQSRIADSDIALVLVSQAFLDSEYCQSVEIATFLERSVEQGLVIVPVILAPCEWRRHPWLASRQCLPGKDQTLEEIFRDRGRRERVFLQLRARLRELVERCRHEPRSDSTAPARAPSVPGLPWTEDGSVLREIGERRPVTVLSCRLDLGRGGQTHVAEDLLERMPPFLDHARQVLDRLGGHVVEQDAIGAELVACFGYPNAFEDDPRRAVECGLELLLQFPRFSTSDGTDSALRIGVHSGEAAVSRRRGGLDISLANLPRQASALIESAPAGTVLLSETTYRLVRKHYHCQVLPDRRLDSQGETTSQLAAVGAPVRHRVLAKADEGGDSPIGPIGPNDEAPVGRRRELELLVDRWELAREGVGQVVLLIGESGLGKSSLLKALKDKLLAEPRTLLECHCSPDHAGSPFYPILELGQRLLANDTEDPRDALLVGSPDHRLKHQARRLGELLEVPRSEGPSTLEMCAVSQGRHLLLGLLQPLLEVARRRPLLLLVEDLEWCDPSTLELLSELVAQVATAPVLMVLTCRPGGEPDWDLPCHLTQLTLGRLARRHVETLVRRLARGLRLPPELMEMIVSRADGVPLFVEELTRWVLDAEDDRQDTLGVPASLQSGLTARLDRLGSAKSVAQLAAALGRDFDEDQLRAVSELDDEILANELERLVDAGLVHRRGWSPQARYTFTHSLIRSAAHESLFRKQRRATHRHIAFVLEDRFPEIGRRNPETMAWHYEEAGLQAAALTCWRRAAEQTVRDGAVCESILHARRGLRVLGELCRTPDLIEHEASLQIVLGAALCAAHGYASQEAREAYRRAESLCDELDEAARRIPVLEALAAYQMLRGRVGEACVRARELVRISEETGEGVEAAHRTLGFSLLLGGELSGCRRHIEEGLGGFSLEEGVAPTESESLGGHPAAASLGDLSWVAWFEGRFSEAVELSEASLAMARSSDNPFCRLYTLLRAAYLQVFLRQAQNARRLAGQLVAEAQHRGSLVFLAMGHVLDGITLALQGRNGEGSRKISQGLDGLWATGFGTGQPRNLALLASVLGACGEVDEGLSLLRQAAQNIELRGACLFEAEVYRIQGELQALAEQPPTEVRRSLAQALAVARQQGAVALELRALTSLVRVGTAADPEGAWRDSDRRRLSEVLDRLSAEAETADLRDARSLLEGAG